MIQTSYFAKAARLPNAVAISQGIPEWYHGERYSPLAPPWELVKGGDRTRFKEEYYQEVLSKLDPKQVAADLDGKILLCHEKDSTHCHRRIVAEWLESALKITVPEIKFIRDKLRAIYERPGEYPDLGLNPYTGCSHRCLYCYNNRDDRQKGSYDKPSQKATLDNIKLDLNLLREMQDKRPVLLSLMGDPYDVGRCVEQKKLKGLEKFFTDEQKANMCTTDNNSYIRRILTAFRDYDQPFQILTKGGKLAAGDFDLYRSNDSFGVTLTFDNDEDSKKWEPGAALPSDRIAALEEAHNRGIRTWVSCEPVIFEEQTLHLIDMTHKFTDCFRVGKLNRSSDAAWTRPKEWPAIDWVQFRNDVVELLEYRGKQPGTGYQLKHQLRAAR